MVRLTRSLFPHMNTTDIANAIDYSIKKRVNNYNVNIYNNYTNTEVDMTVLEMLDYIESREPIKTAYGVLFKRHEAVPNPMAKVIQSFLDLRKIHKKEMFKYPKGSEMFERYNLQQNLDKIDVNGVYGLLGLYISILYNENVAVTVTSTGRSLISSAILCFEGFLGNNVLFGSLNDILMFIDHVRMEGDKWQFNDYDVLGSYGFADVNEVFNKIIMNCGYKYIPTTEDMNIVYSILQNCNQQELNRLFYKNNLYCFMDLPIARDLMIKIVTGMKTPYLVPDKPPKEIVNELNMLRDMLVEYVFYCHQYIDRTDRNKNMIKKISLVSDTDSSFVSLDAWYNYNLSYLSQYDCPILHQQIDMVRYVDQMYNSDDWSYYDDEGNKYIPEWASAYDKIAPAVTFDKPDEYGDYKKYIGDAVEFVEPEYDYDFYSEQKIEQQRFIDPIKIIPQDNMRFALINIMCYVLSTVINLYMLDFTKQSGSYRGDSACRINMKNEFYMTRILLSGRKHYASLQVLQEGNYLGGVLDCKGIDCLQKSTSPPDTKERLRKILLEDILKADKIDQIKIIKDIALLEQHIYDDLRAGSRRYYKPVTIKALNTYNDATKIQGIKAAVAYNYIKADQMPAIDLTDRNPIDIIKLNVNKYTLETIKDDFPWQYSKILEILDPNNEEILDGVKIKDWFKGKLDSVALPKDVTVPGWILKLINYDDIIGDNIKGFPVSAVGISKMDSRNPNYTNVIRL